MLYTHAFTEEHTGLAPILAEEIHTNGVNINTVFANRMREAERKVRTKWGRDSSDSESSSHVSRRRSSEPESLNSTFGSQPVGSTQHS